MGNYDNIVKIEEMRKCMEEGNAQKAQKILDTMEIKKIKNMSDLSLIAEVYAQNERFEEAESLYLKIYDKTKSRKSLYQLLNISIINNNAEDAQKYLKEYQKLAPRDFYKHIFEYKIAKLKGEPYERLIEILETLKNAEYMEKWAYELAKTYYKAGKDKECMRECSDIILWFGEGVYVEKAKILKSYFSGETDKEKIMEELKHRSLEDTGKREPITQDKNSTENAAKEQGFVKREATAGEATETDVALEKANDKEVTEASNQRIKEKEITEKEVVEEKVTKEKIIEEVTEGKASEEEEAGERVSEISLQKEDERVPRYEGEITADKYVIEEEADEIVDILKKDIRNIMLELSEEEGEDNNDNNSFENLISDAQEIAEEAHQERVPLAELHQEQAPQASSEEIVRKSETEREIAEAEVEAALYQLLADEDQDEEDKKLNKIAEEMQVDVDKIFGNFLHVKSIKKQLVKSLEGIQGDHTKTVQIIITGMEGSGKTTLAKDITLFLNKCGKLNSSKIAKIKAERLNEIDVMSKKDTLRDCCLVIENASELRRQTIDSILELCNSLKGNIAVILEENKKNMNKLFRECPKLMDLYKNRIHLPIYTTEDITGFAIACLRQQDYRLNTKAGAILKEKVNQIIKQAEPNLQLEQIYNLMQAVMNAADIRTGKQLSNLAAQGKLQEVDVLTILPEDFEITP